ncbi:EXS family-domain-containing protein [Blastocladiella britannica]|nr:EXS family-domain-containing protein [Blastocladiella britannica]
MELPCFIFLIWSVFVYINLTPVVLQLDVSPLWLPLVFFSFVVVFWISPLNYMHRGARFWLVRTLARILTSGSRKVLFRDFFLTDILCSLVYSLNSLPLFVCVSVGQSVGCNTSTSAFSLVFAAIPPFLRLVQCGRRYYDSGNLHPHGSNALKYILSLSVVTASYIWRVQGEESGALVVWIGLSVVTTVYATGWDLFFDWGFMDRKHGMLRAERLLGSDSQYYFALVSNVVLRLGWVLQLSPGHWFPTVSLSSISLLLALLETLRRVQWSLYRMENEHLSNVGQYRATKDIPLPHARDGSEHDDDDDLEANNHNRHRTGSSREALQSRLQILKRHVRGRKSDDDSEEEVRAADRVRAGVGSMSSSSE